MALICERLCLMCHNLLSLKIIMQARLICIDEVTNRQVFLLYIQRSWHVSDAIFREGPPNVIKIRVVYMPTIRV